MIAIALRFHSGRFHATPWGRHVNEGAAEWPPSPWRFLRALVATWKRKLDTEIAESDMLSLLTRLATPPSFVLPPATTGHSRHYMPWFKKGPEDKTLVFDAFVAVNKTADLLVVWQEVELTMEMRWVLAKLVENLGFLGRSESWCDGRVLDDQAAQSVCSTAKGSNGDGPHWCEPLEERPGAMKGGQAGRAEEVVRVLCPDPATAFLDDYVVRMETGKTGRGKTRQTETTRHPIYEPNWHLCIETKLLHDEKWSDPPGSRWVQYARRSDCFRVASSRRTLNAQNERPRRVVTVARYILDGTVLPLVTDTLPIAESARFTLMGIYKRLKLDQHYRGQAPRPLPADAPTFRSEVFSGKDGSGTRLTNHRHAYFLPSDEDGDGRLDHLTVVADMGIGAGDPLEIRALDQFPRLRWEDGDPLNLMLIAIGNPTELRAPIISESKQWVSATPFIVTRHLKSNGKKADPRHWRDPYFRHQFVEQVLREEIARLRQRRPEIPEPVEIRPLPGGIVDDRGGLFQVPVGKLNESGNTARWLRPIQFKRFRKKRGDDGGRRDAGSFLIRFDKKVAGPICLGHSSHYGMGLFLPGYDD